MGLVYEYLTFAGKSSEDFKCHISGSGTYISPARDIESISIPGRNGDLHIDNGKFGNIAVTYPAFITEDFSANYAALKAFLLSKTGYEILADSYHPDHYRRAIFTGNISPKMTTLNRAGSFELTFDCDPRMFMRSGDEPLTAINGSKVFNRTLFPSKPLIRAYGKGSLTIGSISIEITSANEYTDIDCEIQEAFKGSTNCNSNITLTDGVFPELQPGETEITLDGITSLEITPRWWTV